jgi:hypothetical protein
MRTTTFVTLALAAMIFATPLLAQADSPPPPQSKREFMREHPQARKHMKMARKYERKAMKHRMKARGEMREWRMENGMPPFGPNFGGPNCPNPGFNRGPMMQGPMWNPQMRGPNPDCPQREFCPNPDRPIQKRQHLRQHRAF